MNKGLMSNVKTKNNKMTIKELIGFTGGVTKCHNELKERV